MYKPCPDWPRYEEPCSVIHHVMRYPLCPFWTLCPQCDWQEGDEECSREDLPGRPICRRCGGSGWVECQTINDFPYIISEQDWYQSGIAGWILGVQKQEPYWSQKYNPEGTTA